MRDFWKKLTNDVVLSVLSELGEVPDEGLGK